MRDELEIMLKSHECLREEIVNSISWQNRFVIAVVPIISALLGLGLTEEGTLRLLLVALPPAVIVFTAFWLVEQSRMMRAGDYLQLLEDEINSKARGAFIAWENWLRIGMAGGAHTIYHISQYFGIIGMLYIISGFSIWKIIISGLLPPVVSALYIAMLIFMLVLIVLVVQHRPKERVEFKCWRKVYWEEWVEGDITSAKLKAELKRKIKEVKCETKR